MASAIRMQGVVKRFGALTAVAGLDLDVPDGTCVGLLGPNGAGKSTTMRLLTGQAIADEGELEVLGYKLPAESKVARAECGVVPQLDNLDTTLTVEQNLLVFTYLYRVPRGERLRLRCASTVTARRAAQLLMQGRPTPRRLPAAAARRRSPPRRWHEVLASLAVPGLGQWLQGRFATGTVMFTPQPVNAQAFLKGKANPPVAVRWQPHKVWSSCDGSLAVNTNPGTIVQRPTYQPEHAAIRESVAKIADAVLVGLVDHVGGRLRVHQHFRIRVLCLQQVEFDALELVVHQAGALPQQHVGARLLLDPGAQVLVRRPQDFFSLRMQMFDDLQADRRPNGGRDDPDRLGVPDLLAAAHRQRALPAPGQNGMHAPASRRVPGPCRPGCGSPRCPPRRARTELPRPVLLTQRSSARRADPSVT